MSLQHVLHIECWLFRRRRALWRLSVAVVCVFLRLVSGVLQRTMTVEIQEVSSTKTTGDCATRPPNECWLHLKYLPSCSALPLLFFVYLWKRHADVFFNCNVKCTSRGKRYKRPRKRNSSLLFSSPRDFPETGSILKIRMACWPLLTLLSFTSSMSGSEFIAQRKLAFHVLGSQAWPSMYFPEWGIFF